MNAEVSESAVAIAAYSLARQTLLALRRAGLISDDQAGAIIDAAIKENLAIDAPANREVILLLSVQAKP